MGYDMSIRGEVPAAPQHDIEQAEAAYEAAHAVFMKRAGEFKGNLDASLEASRESDKLWVRLMDLKHPGEFRLNTWGMEKYRNAMADLGMGHWSNDPVASADWSTLPQYEVDEDETAYYEALDKLTGRHGDSDDPTIPLHKFSSNDGWYVTPEEIRAALNVYDTRCTADVRDETYELIQTEYWGRWINYLRLAADHDGLRVH